MTKPELEVVDAPHLVRELNAERQATFERAACKRGRGEPLSEDEVAVLSAWERPFPAEIRKDAP